MLPSFYIQLARDAIQSRFEDSKIDKDAILKRHPEMSLHQATFVTLTLHEQLRGCIGSIIAHRPLIDDIIYNAQSAAFNDPRFSSLTLLEFHEMKVEVSLLSEPKNVPYSDKNDLIHFIHPGVDGVILRLGDHQATFLPQVWDDLNDFESFFTHLGLKAGIGSDPLSLHPEIYTYQVDKIKEE